VTDVSTSCPPDLGNQILINRYAGDQMLLNDPLEHRRVTAAIPRPFGIDDGDGAAFANAQTVCLRAQDTTGLRQPELFEPLLQKFPRLD
jgi:hypothetical protein